MNARAQFECGSLFDAGGTCSTGSAEDDYVESRMMGSGTERG